MRALTPNNQLIIVPLMWRIENHEIYSFHGSVGILIPYDKLLDHPTNTGGLRGEGASVPC